MKTILVRVPLPEPLYRCMKADADHENKSIGQATASAVHRHVYGVISRTHFEQVARQILNDDEMSVVHDYADIIGQSFDDWFKEAIATAAKHSRDAFSVLSGDNKPLEEMKQLAEETLRNVDTIPSQRLLSEA